MEIREANLNDLDDIVRTHLSAFKDFFLSKLGEKFLKVYYKSFLESPEGIVLVCCHERQLLGFCATCTRSAGFNKRLLLNNIVRFGKHALRLIMTKPRAVLRLVKNMSKEGEVKDDGEYSELFSIGVTEDAQGKGVGKLLLKRLDVELRIRKIAQLSLTTDYEDNQKAIGFYKSNGFEVLYEFVTYPNRKMYRLIKEL